MTDFRRRLMLPGFLAAFVGDWFLAIRGCPRGSTGFWVGVLAFSVAQICWTLAQVREARPDPRVLTAIIVPLTFFVIVRLFSVLDGPIASALLAYAALSSISLATALATRRWAYAIGIALLLVSDLAIGCRWLRVPQTGHLVGPLYLAAEVALMVSFFFKNEPRFDIGRGRALPLAVFTGTAGVACYLTAMALFPGEYYNPCMRMLSALGRTQVKSVVWPASHFLFTLGMLVSALGIARFGLLLPGFRSRFGLWGLALNVAGLLTIAAVPENINITVHNVGCWLAALGGVGMLWTWRRVRRGRRYVWFWSALLFGTCVLLGTGLLLHAFKVIAFAPWVPTAQKLLILSFASWLLYLAWKSPNGVANYGIMSPNKGEG